MERLGKGKLISTLVSSLNPLFFLFLWKQNSRARESSVVISPQWSMLEEIEFHRLAKLRLEVDEPEELYVQVRKHKVRCLPYRYRDSYGRLFPYDKSYDRITTKSEKPLQLVDRIKYNTTTSDDPIIQQVYIF